MVQNVSTATPAPAQELNAQPVRADLIGDNVARACGIVAHNGAPLLKLCRLLVDAGFDPNQPLEAWRDDVLCLRVGAIGQAAALEVNGEGGGFRRLRQPNAAPPMRRTGRGAP